MQIIKARALRARGPWLRRGVGRSHRRRLAARALHAAPLQNPTIRALRARRPVGAMCGKMQIITAQHTPRIAGDPVWATSG